MNVMMLLYTTINIFKIPKDSLFNLNSYKKQSLLKENCYKMMLYVSFSIPLMPFLLLSFRKAIP